MSGIVSAVGARTALGGCHRRDGRGGPCSRRESCSSRGDRARAVYLCVSGQIRIFMSLSSGRELVLGTKEPGEVFGEIAALDTLPRSAGASAVGQTVVASMPGDRFAEEVFRDSALALEVLRGLAADPPRDGGPVGAHQRLHGGAHGTHDPGTRRGDGVARSVGESRATDHAGRSRRPDRRDPRVDRAGDR